MIPNKKKLKKHSISHDREKVHDVTGIGQAKKHLEDTEIDEGDLVTQRDMVLARHKKGAWVKTLGKKQKGEVIDRIKMFRDKTMDNNPRIDLRKTKITVPKELRDDVQLDEITKEKLGKYITRATHDYDKGLVHSSFRSGKLYGKELATKRKSKADRAASHKENITSFKRERGIGRAVSKLTGKAKVPATEETELKEKCKGKYKGKNLHNYVQNRLKGKSDEEKKMYESEYNKDSVDQAIASSNRAGRKIGKGEAKKIHGLLKGWRGSKKEKEEKMKDK